MTAARPFAPKAPTVRALQAQLDVYAVELAILHKAQPAVMLAALRLIAAEADKACRASTSDADRRDAMATIRKIALTTICETKE